MRRIAALAALLLAATAAAAAPGGSARVAFDRSAITARSAAGIAAPGRAFAPDTPVRIASVSKLVVAIGVMRLVEAGQLDLDADVSSRLGWRLRNPAFPGRAVTLRQLLSHTSGLTDAGDDYAVPLGRSLRAAIGSANWLPHPPGSFFSYANFNYPVVAQVMERTTGERFDRLMARLVLDPLGLDACFNWTTCSDAAVARAAMLTDVSGTALRDDLRGRRPACPVNRADGVACDLDAYRPGDNGALFSPQGGLRISAEGLARVGRMLLGDGAIDGRRLLAPASVVLMRTPHWRWNGGNGDTENGLYCAFGLGVHLIGNPGCADNLAGDGRARFGHSGEAYALRSGLWLDPAAKTGVAFAVTAVAGDAPLAPGTAFTGVERAALVGPSRPPGR